MMKQNTMMQKVTVIGVGKLGLGLALLMEKGGYHVCGVDIFPEYVEALNQKTYVSKEPQYKELLQTSQNFFATTSLEKGLQHADIIFIVVQTPNSGGDRFYDHSLLSNVLYKINRFQVKNKHIVIGCTVMPKYIDTVGKPLLAECENTTLSYNPEFVAQGDIVSGFLRPDILLIGTESPFLADTLKEIYGSFVLSNPTYCVLTPLESEIVKIGLNGYITTKLSFANMISDVCDVVGADKNKVLHAIGSDSRIGTKYFKPGNSFGGPCFPRDTKALKGFVDQCGVQSHLLTATTEYNKEHIRFQAEQILVKAQNQWQHQNVSSSYITIENVCFKENCGLPLIEESAKLKMAEYLVKEKHQKVVIRDNEDVLEEVKKEYGNLFEYEVGGYPV